MAQGEVSNTTGIFRPGSASRAASWRALPSAASISPLDQNGWPQQSSSSPSGEISR